MRKTLIGVCLLSMLGCTQDIKFNGRRQENLFRQNSSSAIKKLDMLWIIDNSGSMETSQMALATNLSTFVDRFMSRNLDFQIAVGTTEAYLTDFTGDLSYSQFRDGNPNDGPSGYAVVTPQTPNLKDVLLRNFLQGIAGDGDERALQSTRAILDNPLNSGFVRPDGFLAIVILSDEDDFSHNGSNNIAPDYANPALHSLDMYRNYLDDSLQHDEDDFYSVSSITIRDQACLDILSQMSVGQRIGYRHMELAQQTSGVEGSLCDDFSQTLASISANILERLTMFRLETIPEVSTLAVSVNNVPVPRDAQNGWTYSYDYNAIIFHGDSIPNENSEIRVVYNRG